MVAARPHTQVVCAADQENKKSMRDIIEEEAGKAGVGGFEQAGKKQQLSPEQDYPYILDREPDFSIFSKDVVLQDLQGFSIRGKQAYQLFFGLLRRLKKAVFANTSVSVLLMDKYSPYATDKSQIRLRWKIEAGERLPDVDRTAMLQSMGFDSASSGSLKLKSGEGDILEGISVYKKVSSGGGSLKLQSGEGGILEGISVYKLDVKGYITSHKIQVTQPTMFAPLQALKSRLPQAFNNMIPNVSPH
ncbi:hypothetical protein T484DRAFT_1816592 [Baffinella frigidus]|nr:hypothetical protein T484DRAFT_1816592 [Cryptophyta sp. CCMP2293]